MVSGGGPAQPPSADGEAYAPLYLPGIGSEMLTREHVMELLRTESGHLAKEFGVRKIGLFGSFARDAAGEESDVDLVVEFDRPIGFRFMELADHLERLLGRRVDLLTPEGVRSIRNPRIAREIASNLLYV